MPQTWHSPLVILRFISSQQDLSAGLLEGVKLFGALIDRDTTRFQGAHWGEKMILGEELGEEWAEGRDSYRVLKQWHQHNGDYDMAGIFHYREWECRRKLTQQNWNLPDEAQDWSPKRKLTQRTGNLWDIAKPWAYRVLNGYGEHAWLVPGLR